jgi:hypothetical protein
MPHQSRTVAPGPDDGTIRTFTGKILHPRRLVPASAWRPGAHPPRESSRADVDRVAGKSAGKGRRCRLRLRCEQPLVAQACNCP